MAGLVYQKSLFAVGKAVAWEHWVVDMLTALQLTLQNSAFILVCPALRTIANDHQLI